MNQELSVTDDDLLYDIPQDQYVSLRNVSKCDIQYK